MVADKPAFQEKGYNKFLFPVWPQFGEAEEKILREVLLAEEGVLAQIVRVIRDTLNKEVWDL